MTIENILSAYPPKVFLENGIKVYDKEDVVKMLELVVAPKIVIQPEHIIRDKIFSANIFGQVRSLVYLHEALSAMEDYGIQAYQDGLEVGLASNIDSQDYEKLIAFLSTDCGLMDYRWDEGLTGVDRVISFLKTKIH